MKTEDQIRQKLKQTLRRNLQKRMRANFKQKPGTCIFNRRPYHIEPDDPGRSKPAQCPHVCIHAERGGWVCDERHGGLDLAKACPHWEARQTGDEIKAQFTADYREMAVRAKQGHKHPEFPVASTLMWVLGDELPESPEPEAPMDSGEDARTLEVKPEEEPKGELEPSIRRRSVWGHPAWPWNWFR